MSTQAQAQHRQAVEAWQRGQRPQALALLRQAHAQLPDQPAITADLARAEMGLGLAEPARMRAAALAAQHPQWQALAQELAQAYLNFQRPPALAGRFYAAEPQALAEAVDALLAQAPAVVADAPCPKVLVLPHAGHVYSGAMAARGYALLRPHLQRIRKIVLYGPTHRMAVRGLAMPGVGSFATPLGDLEVDSLAMQSVADMPQMQNVPQAHAQEHGLEVHLPFIQRLWAGRELPRIVPLLVGAISPADVMQVMQCLWGGEDTLHIVSTDLSHFHPYDEARQMDLATCAQVMAGQTSLNHQQACGATPLNAMLQCAQAQGLRTEQIGYCNSGDTAGDTPEGRERVVGYASFALYEAPKTSADGPVMDEAMGAQLLRLARAGLQQALGMAWPAQPAPDIAGLSAPGASFVTLTAQGRLRGCIGSLQAHRPLHEDVLANAASAALRDPRFAPVQAHEAEALQLEVSVLTPAQPLAFANEAHALWLLQPQVHGVILEVQHEGRAYRSTFLPQVWSQMPDPRQFLVQLKRKAGLPPDFWSDQVRLQVYRVRKFEEAPRP